MIPVVQLVLVVAGITQATALSSTAVELKTPTSNHARVNILPQKKKLLMKKRKRYTVSLRPRPPLHVPPPLHLFDQIVIMEDGVVGPHDNGLYDYDEDDEVSMDMLYDEDAGEEVFHIQEAPFPDSMMYSVSTPITEETASIDNGEWVEESIMQLDEPSPRLNWVVTKGEAPEHGETPLEEEFVMPQVNGISLEEQKEYATLSEKTRSSSPASRWPWGLPRKHGDGTFRNAALKSAPNAFTIASPCLDEMVVRIQRELVCRP